MRRKTSTTWLPVAHGSVLALDFSSSRWKGVTASEDGRRDATINRRFTRRRGASSILSSVPFPPRVSLFLSHSPSLPIIILERPSFRKLRATTRFSHRCERLTLNGQDDFGYTTFTWILKNAYQSLYLNVSN